jgi:hypothetical protein
MKTHWMRAQHKNFPFRLMFLALNSFLRVCVCVVRKKVNHYDDRRIVAWVKSFLH